MTSVMSKALVHVSYQLLLTVKLLAIILLQNIVDIFQVSRVVLSVPIDKGKVTLYHGFVALMNTVG